MLYLNKNLFIFGKTDTKLCSFCQLEGETPFELFANCTKTNILWANIKEFFQWKFKTSFTDSTECHEFSFLEVHQYIFLILNHILLLFKGAL